MSAPLVRIGTLTPDAWSAAFPYAHDDAAAQARRDQMFLRQALRTQRRSIAPIERHAFDARADRILAQLDPPPAAPAPAAAAIATLTELPARAWRAQTARAA